MGIVGSLQYILLGVVVLFACEPAFIKNRQYNPLTHL